MNDKLQLAGWSSSRLRQRARLPESVFLDAVLAGEPVTIRTAVALIMISGAQQKR